MPERVTARVLDDAGVAQRALDGTLEAAPLSGEVLHVVAGRREHPLPAELAAGVGILPRQRVGHGDPAGAGLEVPAMLPAYRLDLRQQPGLGGDGEHRHTVLGALAAANDLLVGGEVHILDAQLSAFQQPKAAPRDALRPAPERWASAQAAGRARSRLATAGSPRARPGTRTRAR